MAGSFIGQKVGDYEIVARVGSGGMGAVFEAKHPVIGKRIAVKVLHPAFSKDPKVLERFLNEAKVVNAIGHPAIVDIFSIGQTADGLPYFLMEFLKGEPLSDVLKREGALPVPRALELIAQLLEVLDRAHGAGVVHRDLKPHNLFLEQRAGTPRLRVLDFGIAKSLTPELKQAFTGSAILGTPGYLSPEQANSEPVTAQTDLYSAGAVLFELVTGRQIFVGQNIAQLLMKALYEEAPRASTVRPDVPSAVDDFIAQLLSRAPSGRPASAAAALATVRALLSGNAPAPGAAEREVATVAVKAVAPKPAPHASTERELDPVRDRVETKPSTSVPRRPEPSAPAERRGLQPVLDVSKTTVDPELVARATASPKRAVWPVFVVIGLLLVSLGAWLWWRQQA